MRITICHLSDIHFALNNNSLLEKQEKMCDAILQDAKKNDVIIFIISGDIAQSGQATEYEIALDFFVRIQEYLLSAKSINSLFFFVPGNHDCDFSDEQRNKDDNLRRSEIIKNRNEIKRDDLTYYIKSLCNKQQNYRDFVELFDYVRGDSISVTKKYISTILVQYEINIDKIKISLNLLNTAWLTERKETPGYLFIPEQEYKHINKDNTIVITVYHHPSNWMHPNDRNEFNRWVMNKSDLIYVGHEHNGRNEDVTTRDTAYQAQYGEVLQERGDDSSSGFIINYIEDNSKETKVFRWDKEDNLYNVSYDFNTVLNSESANYLYFQKDFNEFLETPDIRITHPSKEKIGMRDLFVYPDIEAYKGKRGSYELSQNSITIKGEQLLHYILSSKKISFSGSVKSGKTALAKMLLLDLIEMGKYGIFMDCSCITVLTDKSLKKQEEICISRAYGKEYVNKYRQLKLDNKVLILDNFGYMRGDAKKNILTYFDNYYDYILTFSNTTFEVELLEESLNNERSDYIHCSISELGYKKRNHLITKWYSLNEGGDPIVDEVVRDHVAEAMSTINVLKGNGYMPCIPAHILIILQQLEYSVDGGNQERSNYGYLYEFLIMKSINDMNRNCEYIHKDIAFGILTYIAEYMLQNSIRIVSEDDYKEIVSLYNNDFDTEASSDLYMDEYERGELLDKKDGQISFCFPYIHYYFTAKFLANNISKEWPREKILDISRRMFEEECGDIMVFLCHLSKDDYIIDTVLGTAKQILSNMQVFDFKDHSSINMSFDEYIQQDFIPEIETEERQERLLEIQDENERKREKRSTAIQDANLKEEIYNLDNAFKTIEVMGQILKNYPGTIAAMQKKALLEEIYSLGMRTLTYTSDIIHGGIEKVFEEIRKNLQPNPSPLELGKIAKMIREINNSMDNLFGLLSYAMVRNLANSVANKALMPVIRKSDLNGLVGYELVKNAINLNEFGIISVDLILNEYDEYIKNNNIFAAKLLRLLVLDHYFVFGSKDLKKRQKIWQKMNFGNKEKVLALQGDRI